MVPPSHPEGALKSTRGEADHVLEAMLPAADTCAQPDLRTTLDEARRVYWEDPAGSLAVAVRCAEQARSAGDAELRSRALALQGAITLHRGDLPGAVALAADAERAAEIAGSDPARVEVAALKGHLSFFSGSYADAVAHAQRAMALADRAGDLDLRVFGRRAACLVLGNVGTPDWPDRLDEVLALSIASGNRWEQAISHNDLGCLRVSEGDVAAAEAHLEQGLAIARDLGERNTFALGVLHSTRSDLRLAGGRAEEALADAEEAIAQLTAGGEPNPYVFGVTVRAHVQALHALGRLDEAQRSGEGALERLGDRVPQARSLVLSTLAEALREAGRLEEAYDTLARSAALEREAFQELSELQRSLERATLEAGAARREADALREQAERDWLTGLHNRRYLARELERLSRERRGGHHSVAVLDLDHFKAVNDTFGHDAGDAVLARVAALLVDHVRTGDAVVRTGGEEFVVLMPATDAEAAIACCERLRAVIAEERWDGVAGGMRVTASVGVATSPDASELEALAKLADERLFAAKRAGRDRVVASG
jgi:diguanylate cyclase (GGDEF)-like protein